MNLKRIESLGRGLRVRDLRVRDLRKSIQDRGASRYSDLAAISLVLLLALVLPLALALALPPAPFSSIVFLFRHSASVKQIMAVAVGSRSNGIRNRTQYEQHVVHVWNLEVRNHIAYLLIFPRLYDGCGGRISGDSAVHRYIDYEQDLSIFIFQIQKIAICHIIRKPLYIGISKSVILRNRRRRIKDHLVC